MKEKFFHDQMYIIIFFKKQQYFTIFARVYKLISAIEFLAIILGIWLK